MHIKNLKHLICVPTVLLAAALTSGCSMVTDDLEPCPAQLRVKFVYDYNIKWGDAFAHEVSSVNIWAFNSSGAPVWSGSADGSQLASGEFYLDTPLEEGDYDFVAWCGLHDNNQFNLATYNPASKEELEVTLRTIEEEDGIFASRERLSALFHAEMSDVEYEINPNLPTQKIVTASLMKDTKDIRVILRNINGTELEDKDYTVSITIPDNSLYSWNNDLLPSETVTYFPWDIRYGVTSKPEDTDLNDSGTRADETITTIATLVFDLSTGRLMKNDNSNRDAVLTIHRNWDNRDIVKINLIEYLLLIKGHYGDISDQEYLDRQDDYSIAFFLDPSSNFYVGGVVFINGWAVVPPQHQDF